MAGIDVQADQRACGARAEEGLRWIEQHPEIQTVVMGLFGHYDAGTDVAFDHRYGVTGPSRMRINAQTDPVVRHRLLAQGLDAAVARLVAAGKQVVIVLDTPEFPFDPPNCYAPPRRPWARPVCAVPLAQVLDRQAPLRAMLSRIAGHYPGVRLFDPLPVLCPDGTCDVGDATRPLYRDSHHLSALGSETIGTALVSAMRRTAPNE